MSTYIQKRDATEEGSQISYQLVSVCILNKSARQTIGKDCHLLKK